MTRGGYMNPYQQNVDIIKGFFKRKLILFFSISIILPIFSIIFINLNDIVYIFNHSIEVNDGGILSSFTKSTDLSGSFSLIYILFVFQILLAVVFLLFFVKSGSEDSSLKAPIGIFRVVSIIELIITAIILIGMVFAVLFSSLYIMATFPIMISILTVPFMFAAIPVMMLLVVSQALFADSIKDSVNTIYLKRKGTKLYGVTNCIMAVLCVYMAVMLAVFNSSLIPVTIFLGLIAVKFIFGSLVGLKYAKYIEGFSDSPTVKAEDKPAEESPNIIVCKKCGKPLTPDDYFCNHCGTPVEK